MKEPSSNIRPTGDHLDISSILAGFGFAMGIQLIAYGDKRLIASLSIIAFMVSACMFLMLSYVYFITRPTVYLIDKSRDKERVERYQSIAGKLYVVFFTAMVLLLAGVALAGWMHSTLVGILTTATAVIVLLLSVWFSSEILFA